MNFADLVKVTWTRVGWVLMLTAILWPATGPDAWVGWTMWGIGFFCLWIPIFKASYLRYKAKKAKS